MVARRLNLAFADFRRTPKPFMEKYGANVAGFFWNLGTVFLYIFGAIEFSPRILVAAFINTLSPCSYMFFGHKTIGVVTGSLLGILGTYLTVYPEIMEGQPSALFAFAAFIFFVMLNILGVPLTRRYLHDKNYWRRQFLGHPRRWAGLGALFLTRMPIVYESCMARRWNTALVFAIWGLGDIALSFSKVDLRKAAPMI